MFFWCQVEEPKLVIISEENFCCYFGSTKESSGMFYGAQAKVKGEETNTAAYLLPVDEIKGVYGHPILHCDKILIRSPFQFTLS